MAAVELHPASRSHQTRQASNNREGNQSMQAHGHKETFTETSRDTKEQSLLLWMTGCIHSFILETSCLVVAVLCAFVNLIPFEVKLQKSRCYFFFLCKVMFYLILYLYCIFVSDCMESKSVI